MFWSVLSAAGSGAAPSPAMAASRRVSAMRRLRIVGTTSIGKTIARTVVLKVRSISARSIQQLFTWAAVFAGAHVTRWTASVWPLKAPAATIKARTAAARMSGAGDACTQQGATVGSLEQADMLRAAARISSRLRIDSRPLRAVYRRLGTADVPINACQGTRPRRAPSTTSNFGGPSVEESSRGPARRSTSAGSREAEGSAPGPVVTQTRRRG